MTSSSPTPPVLSRVDPVDVLAYLWSLKKFIPVGILVGAAVMAAMILPNRDSGAQLSAVSVQTNVRVQTADTMGAGSTSDASAAAATYATLGQSPSVLGSVDVPGVNTPELLRARLDIFSTGTVVVIKVNGLLAADATKVAKVVAERVAAQTTSTPVMVGGQPATMVVQEPFEVPGSAVTRSLIQSYVLAAMVGGVAGLGSMIALGWFARRRKG
ncbi:MAG TPA: hypothetical protein PLA46_07945 [Phycicoccus sp.]|jgi:hypothetical protein|nr:hypothetical protein [Phycicoccus sp.]HQH06973.1 hypothetical protein [Phycicoccus sp.]HQK32121.1 hypothetical protein [Phycicoccus sp.]HQV91500.1 hypothetical protein [Phycicoccus sp.]HQY96084.1 hypothetical protein [Phycicoccus sp.]